MAPYSQSPVAAFFIITPARIGQWLHDRAKELAQAQFGWMILWAAISMPSPPYSSLLTQDPVIISFPPLIGCDSTIVRSVLAEGEVSIWFTVPDGD